ncbi:hypothetical protein CYI99_010940, partial [Staphylococcus pseudintermedius]
KKKTSTGVAVSTEASEIVSAEDSWSQVTSNGSTTKEAASTFVPTVYSSKDKASNNGTPSEFESVVVREDRDGHTSGVPVVVPTA